MEQSPTLEQAKVFMDEHSLTSYDIRFARHADDSVYVSVFVNGQPASGLSIGGMKSVSDAIQSAVDDLNARRAQAGYAAKVSA